MKSAIILFDPRTVFYASGFQPDHSATSRLNFRCTILDLVLLIAASVNNTHKTPQ
jgi:hypothetical protein